MTVPAVVHAKFSRNDRAFGAASGITGAHVPVAALPTLMSKLFKTLLQRGNRSEWSRAR